MHVCMWWLHAPIKGIYPIRTITATWCLMGPVAMSSWFIPESFLSHFASPDVKLDSSLSNRDVPIFSSLKTTTVLE